MTAVEQLVQELKKLGVLKIDDLHWTEQDDVNNAIKQAQAMIEDEAHKAYLYGHEVGFMKAKKPTPIVENKTKNCKKEYNGKGRQAPPPPLHSKKRTEK